VAAEADPPAVPTASTPAVAQPDPTGRWTVLFSGRDPAAWNTAGTAGTYAIPLERAPGEVRYLRLTRLDTGESLIVPVSRDQLKGVVEHGEKPARPATWNGSAQDAFGGRHLGIAVGPAMVGEDKLKGKVPVQMDGLSNVMGSGFGHEAYGGAGQKFAWLGLTIEPTDFEVAVTGDDLTPEEQAQLASSGDH
jgi:hypothetical protein